MIDVSNYFNYGDLAGRPPSVMTVRKDVLSPGAIRLRLVVIDADAQRSFNYEEKAYAFYFRGISEWCMGWESNVFEYDQTSLVRALGNIHRAAKQLGGIAAGVHLPVCVIETVQKKSQRKTLVWLRIAIVAFGALSLVLLFGWLLLRWYARCEKQ